MRKPLVRCWKIFKQYLCNCNIHGLRYLADDQFSYFERIFWLVACGLCWWGCTTMVISVVQDSLENPVAVTPETTFLEWQTPFPSPMFCITSNSVIKNHYYMIPWTLESSAGDNAMIPDDSGEELLEVYEQLKVPCSKIFRNCTWNQKSFNCCEEFLPMRKAGYGHCYTFNSLQTEPPQVRHFINRSVHYGELIVDVNCGREHLKSIVAYLKPWLMNNHQLPLMANFDAKASMRVKVAHTSYILFGLESTANQPGVESVPISRRNCRFHNELINGSFFDTYTFDSCVLQVMVEQMIKFCGCVHVYYYIPPGVRPCAMKDHQCLSQHRTEIMSSEVASVRCLPNCDHMGLIINTMESGAVKHKDISRMHFSTLLFPRLRYRRYVVHDLLDIVVSVGGAVGLFIGASILSIFEIPYWLLIRRDKIN